MDANRLAVILSGAVSLGSFEAGALTELLYVLDRLARRGRRIELDVVTGASAGAMTGALVARAVMSDFARRDALHRAWVDRIDIRTLIEDIPENALLSKKPIERIADDCLRPAFGEAPAPAAFAPRVMRLAFTLSNMNGVDYRFEPAPGGGTPAAGTGEEPRFTSTFFSDRRRFEVEAADPNDHELWKRLREAAIASGNFPLAFAPARVFTDDREYSRSVTPHPDGTFTFVDGGYFNNEPIREAVGLARETDGESLGPGRVFLLIDANLNRSTREPGFDEHASLPATAKRLLEILRGEASANDWLRARRLNAQMGWRDDLLARLAEVVRTNTMDRPEAFSEQLREVGRGIVDRKRALFPGRYDERYLDRAFERTGQRHADLMADLTGIRREIFVRIAFLLNSIAGLDKKSPLDLHVLYTRPEETAGDQLQAFGGFFAREWREHDFRIGRRRAREQLPGILGYDPSDVEADPGGAYDNPVDYSGVEMKDADEAVRRRILDVFVAKGRGLVEGAPLGPRGWRWAITPIASWLAGRLLEKKLSAYLALD